MNTKWLFCIMICIISALMPYQETSAKEENKKKDEMNGKAEVVDVKEEKVYYEESMPNLLVPSNLNPLQVEFMVQHRFEGAVADKPLKNFFGAEEGAAVRLGLRFMIWSKLEVNFGRNFDRHEWDAGLSYAVFIPKAFLKLQLNAQYLNYKYEYATYDFLPSAGTSGRVVNDCFLQLAISTYPIGGRLTPVINLGYDVFNKKQVGLGVGLSLMIVDWFYIQGEFFPNFFKNKWRGTEAGGLNTYAFGVMFQTVSHNFTIMAGNSTQLGSRQMMMGCDGKSIRLGFNITKVFN